MDPYPLPQTELVAEVLCIKTMREMIQGNERPFCMAAIIPSSLNVAMKRSVSGSEFGAVIEGLKSDFEVFSEHVRLLFPCPNL